METSVKERLIGAVILVALIVALVPEILSGPRKSPDVGATAATEQPLRTYTIDLEEHGFPAEREQPESPAPPTAGPTPEQPTTPVSQDDSRETAAAPPAATTTSPSAKQVRPERPSGDPAVASGWAVQLGSFSNAENAERLARELRGRGYRAFVARYESAGQKRMRVRVGPEEERARAEQLAQRLRREGRQATVVAHP